MQKFTEKHPNGGNIVKTGYNVVNNPAYGSYIEGEAVDKLAWYEKDAQMREIQESSQIIFRNVRCWLSSEWLNPNEYHFNFAPLGHDFVDDKGESFFIHCTYEVGEENPYWFSYWYEHNCYEPTLEELTEKERGWLKQEIQKQITKEIVQADIERIAKGLKWIEETAEPIDNQGYEYYIDCLYFGATFTVYISVLSDVSMEMQCAKQVYEQMQEAKKDLERINDVTLEENTEKLSFVECLWLLYECVENKILALDPKDSNSILVYRSAGENSEEGWYSENAHVIARELCEDIEGQNMLREALKEKSK